MPISVQNNRGFTLTELMVAMVITVIGLLGLVEAMSFAARENLRTQQRNEAVQIAEEAMADFRRLPFSMISTCPTCSDGKYSYAPKIVYSKMRNRRASYTVLRTTATGADYRDHTDLGVKVRWQFKDMSTSHEVHSFRYADVK